MKNNSPTPLQPPDCHLGYGVSVGKRFLYQPFVLLLSISFGRRYRNDEYELGCV